MKAPRILIAAIVLSSTVPCGAEDAPPAPPPEPVASARDPAAARALFLEGREALERGDWPAACAKFDASLALNPAVSTLINIAKCQEHDGKLTAALTTYQNALILNKDTPSSTQQGEADELIRAALAAVEKRIPMLRIVVTNPPGELTVTRDGQPLPREVIGHSVALDPGGHSIVVDAPGHVAQRYAVTINEGAVLGLETSLDRAPPPTPPPPPSIAPPPLVPTATPDAGCAECGWLAVAGGMAFAGVGAAFAVDAQATADEIELRCGPERLCDQDVVEQTVMDDLNDRKILDVAVSIAFFAGAGVAVTTGAILLITGDTSNSSAVGVAPWIVPGDGGASLRMRW